MVKWKEKGLENVALSTRIMSKQGCESICRQSFEYAKKFGRKSVTLVEKPNVLRETGGLMTSASSEDVAKDYPGIDAWEANIDAMCMWLIKNPFDYDVLVAENMFGDIISDLAAGLIGGLGFRLCGQHRRRLRRLRANPRQCPQVLRPECGQSRWRCSSPPR